jgi:hypothetical protein
MGPAVLENFLEKLGHFGSHQFLLGHF